MLTRVLIPAMLLLNTSPLLAAAQAAPLPVPEPEPHSMVLLGIALIGAIIVRRNNSD